MTPRKRECIQDSRPGLRAARDAFAEQIRETDAEELYASVVKEIAEAFK
jgi:hypothetical protein